MTADMSVMRLLLEASIPVQLVMLLLIAASIMSKSICSRVGSMADQCQRKYAVPAVG